MTAACCEGPHTIDRGCYFVSRGIAPGEMMAEHALRNCALIRGRAEANKLHCADERLITAPMD